MNAKGQMYSQKVQELVKNVGDNHGNQKRTILKRTYRKKERERNFAF